MFNYIKNNIPKFTSLLITLYLIYGIITVAQFDLDKIKTPIELFIIIVIQISFTFSSLIYLFFLWFRTKSEDKLYRNIIIISTIFILFSFPATYSLLVLGRNLSSVKGIQIGSADGWLAFIGSLLGGVLTMLALVFTIQHENSKRLDEKGINAIPYIKAMSIKDNDIVRNSAASKFDLEVEKKMFSSENYFVDFSLELKNISNNIASSFEFDRKNSSFELSVINSEMLNTSDQNGSFFVQNHLSKTTLDKIGTKNVEPIDLIPTEKIIIPIVIPKSVFTIEMYKNKVYKFKLKLVFKFKDIFGINEYNYILEIVDNINSINKFVFKGQNSDFDVLDYAKKEFRNIKNIVAKK